MQTETDHQQKTQQLKKTIYRLGGSAAGTNPLIVLHSHASPGVILQPVLFGVIVLALVAAVWSRLVPGMVSYPSRWFEKSPPSIS